MQYTRLGRTALKVSRLCLGTMNFGPQTSEEDSFGIMDCAIELGINFFEKARHMLAGRSDPEDARRDLPRPGRRGPLSVCRSCDDKRGCRQNLRPGRTCFFDELDG